MGLMPAKVGALQKCAEATDIKDKGIANGCQEVTIRNTFAAGKKSRRFAVIVLAYGAFLTTRMIHP